MTIGDTTSLAWAHVGDLHITREGETNHRDFLSIIATINAQLAGQIDFCVLPGDNADDGSAAQYALIRRGLQRLTVPVHVISGDHDRKAGDLRAFYQGLGVPRLPSSSRQPRRITSRAPSSCTPTQRICRQTGSQ